MFRSRGVSIRWMALVCVSWISCCLHADGLQSIDPFVSFADPESSAKRADEFGKFLNESNRLVQPVSYDHHHPDDCRCSSCCWTWQVLPDGLIWRSYLAGTHEPRISSLLFYDKDDGAYWDATLGGRVGLLRYGSQDARRPRGWQWDLEGAVMTRLDLRHKEDVESMDYRFGTQITAGEGRWAAKFGYFHISSHVGDEFLIRNSTFERVNYVTESLVLALSYAAHEWMRVYGEMAYAFASDSGAQQWQFQTGMELIHTEPRSRCFSPFAAVNLDVRQAVNYTPTLVIQGGYAFTGIESGRRLRFGWQFLNGFSSQYSFFRERERYLGLGVWFDY